MDEGLFKPINLSDFLKDSLLLNPLKEHYPDYLKQLLQKTLAYWEQNELEKAKEQITNFNSNFDDFQIGELIEIAIGFNTLDVKKTLVYLSSVPKELRSETKICFLYHFTKAVLYYSLWDIDEARNECDIAIWHRPEIALTYYLRATCFALRERHLSAIPDYRRALKGDYKKDEITANLAYSYLRTRNHFKALRLHKRIVNKFPDNHKIQYNTGLSYNRLKNYSKAIFYFNNAILLHPNNAGYKLTRGRVFMRLKKHSKAQLDLQFAAQAGNQIAQKLLEINSQVVGKKISSKAAHKQVLQFIRTKSRQRR